MTNQIWQDPDARDIALQALARIHDEHARSVEAWDKFARRRRRRARRRVRRRNHERPESTDLEAW